MCCIWSHICLIHVPVILHNALSLIFIHYRQNYAVTNLLYSMHITLTWTSLVFSLHFVKYVKVKCILVQALRLCTDRTAHRGSRGIALLFLDYGTRRGWVVSSTPRPHFSPGERPNTHCTGGWVSPRAGLDRCGNLAAHRDSIPGPSSPWPVAIPTELPGPLLIQVSTWN